MNLTRTVVFGTDVTRKRKPFEVPSSGEKHVPCATQILPDCCRGTSNGTAQTGLGTVAGKEVPDRLRREFHAVRGIGSGCRIPPGLARAQLHRKQGPIEQPTAFELVMNLKTAQALGISIPPSIRLRVDRMLE